MSGTYWVDQDAINDAWAEVEEDQKAEFLQQLEDEAKAQAKARGWMVGDMIQTDKWFRD